MSALRILIVVLFCFTSTVVNASDHPSTWPPEKGQSFPDFSVVDQNGERHRISDFKGKVILIEYIGMNCPACQAFSGANDHAGAFENNAVQSNLLSIERLLPQYAGMSLPNPDLVLIQVLLYDRQMQATEPKDAIKWARHFGFQTNKGEYVTVPVKDLRNDASYKLIPGFQLIDRNFILKSDSTGHHPKDDLYRTLLPMVNQFIKP